MERVWRQGKHRFLTGRLLFFKEIVIISIVISVDGDDSSPSSAAEMEESFWESNDSWKTFWFWVFYSKTFVQSGATYVSVEKNWFGKIKIHFFPFLLLQKNVPTRKREWWIWGSRGKGLKLISWSWELGRISILLPGLVHFITIILK